MPERSWVRTASRRTWRRSPSAAALTLLGASLALWLPSAAAPLEREVAHSAAARPVITIDIRDSTVTLVAENAPLVEVLTRIGQEAGFAVVVTGDLKRSTTQSLQNVPLPAALKRLAGDLSHLMIFTHQSDRAGEPVLRELKVYAPNPGGGGRTASGRRAGSAPRLELPHVDHPSAAGRSAVRDLAQLVGEATLADISRSQAETALAWIGDEAALPDLAAALSDPHPVAQLRAVRALGEIGGTRAARLLEAVARKGENPRVRAAAVRASNLISGQFFEDFIGDALVRSGVEQQLETIGEALNRLATDPNVTSMRRGIRRWR